MGAETLGYAALKYLAPSFIEGGLQMLGGIGQAKLQDRSLRKQMEFQAQQNALDRKYSLYNNAMELGFQEYLNAQEAAKAKRLRSSIIAAFRDSIAIGGPGAVSPIVMEPTPPNPQQIAQQSRGIAATLGG